MRGAAAAAALLPCPARASLPEHCPGILAGALNRRIAELLRRAFLLNREARPRDSARFDQPCSWVPAAGVLAEVPAGPGPQDHFQPVARRRTAVIGRTGPAARDARARILSPGR